MTTIAIIGGGIAARSLLFTMAKKKYSQEILVFYSDRFAFPCSLHSTAIVAPRGISTGHSPLGDHLVAGFDRFARHVREDHPAGVIEIPQYTGAITKLEAFKKRYPDGKLLKAMGPVKLQSGVYVAEEQAYLVRPEEYMKWLVKEASSLDVKMIDSFVTEVVVGKVRTINGDEFPVDEVIFTAGVQNSLWSAFFSDKKSKSVQGCYLEFHGVNVGASFSVTLEGDNIIHDHEAGTLLIGSTTHESNLELAPERELKQIYDRVQKQVDLALPAFSSGTLKTGLREKASRREAYVLKHGPYAAIGGLYKNGYRLGLYLSEKLLSLQSSAGKSAGT